VWHSIFTYLLVAVPIAIMILGSWSLPAQKLYHYVIVGYGWLTGNPRAVRHHERYQYKSRRTLRAWYLYQDEQALAGT